MAINLAPASNYDPTTWALGYQDRQFGLSGPSEQETASILNALHSPPEAMITATEVVPNTNHNEPTQ